MRASPPRLAPLLPALLLCILPLPGCGTGRLVLTDVRPVEELAVGISGPLLPPALRDPLFAPGIPWAGILGVGLGPVGGSGGGLVQDASSPDGGRTWDFTLRADLTAADGSVLDATLFCDLWHRQRLPASRSWLREDIAQGPVALDGHKIRFVLAEPRSRFPERWTDPATFLLGGRGDLVWRSSLGAYRMDTGAGAPMSGTANRDVVRLVSRTAPPPGHPPVSAFRLVRAPAAGGGLLLHLGDVDAVRLTEKELAGWTVGRREPLECAPEATSFFLLFGPDAGPGDHALLQRLDRGRLAHRVAPGSGRSIVMSGGASAPPAAAAGEDLPAVPVAASSDSGFILMLVDVDNALAMELADQMQADLWSRGIDLRIDAVPGAVYDGRLHLGRYAVALAGFRAVVQDPILALLGRLHASGLQADSGAGSLHAAQSADIEAERRLTAEQVEKDLVDRRVMLPLIHVDECWAHQQEINMRDHLAVLTAVTAARFRPGTTPGSP